MISEKVQEMAASPIRKLVPYSEMAKKRGIHVYHLNIGQPDLPAPEEAFKVFQQKIANPIEYSHSAGYIGLRETWANYYQKLNIELQSNQMLICNGGSEALIFAFLTCLNPGDELIVPAPYYANYNAFAQIAQVKIRPLLCYIEDNFKLPAVKEIEALITPKTKGILICNPNNPTGYLYTQAELAELAELVKKHQLFLFADEVYREFRYDNSAPDSLLKRQDIDKNLVVIDSVSKRYSLCGARVGALISRNPQIIENALKLAQARLSPPSLGQWVAQAAFSADQNYFTRTIGAYQARKNKLTQGLSQITGVKYSEPLGAFYSIAEFPIQDTDHFAQWLLEDYAYEGKTVMLAPASGFYHKPEEGKKQVRIAYVLAEQDIENSIKVLQHALPIYQAKYL